MKLMDVANIVRFLFVVYIVFGVTAHQRVSGPPGAPVRRGALLTSFLSISIWSARMTFSDFLLRLKKSRISYFRRRHSLGPVPQFARDRIGNGIAQIITKDELR